MDLGDCSKHHDLALRADYEAAAKTKDYSYDLDVSMNVWKWIYTLLTAYATIPDPEILLS